MGAEHFSPPDGGRPDTPASYSTPTPSRARRLLKEGATAVQSLEDAVKALKEKPRAVWVMLPCRPDHRRDGRASRRSVGAGRHHHRWRQFIVQRRYPPRQEFGREGHSLDIDCGCVWRRVGYRSRLLHDDRRSKTGAVDHLDPILATLAPGLGDIPRTPGRTRGRQPRRAWLHPRRSAGAGHFVKMVHNGIEYGLM